MSIFPLPALKDNYIWTLLDEPSKQVIVVDPGEAPPVINLLNQQQLSLAGIIITHHHWDHTNGIKELLDYAGTIPVFASHQSPVPFINRHVKDGDNISCANFHFRVIAIPGHTLDHTAYYDAQNLSLFTGDTLFSAGCGRIFEGTAEMMLASLQKILSLSDNTKIYCGHEYTRANLHFAQAVEPNNHTIKEKLSKLPTCTLPSLLHEEKLINPFLRCSQPDVILAAENYTNKKLPNAVNVFAALREWKNNY